MKAFDWHVSPLAIIETERAYPGLMDDLGTEAWQDKLIADQLGTTSGHGDGDVDGLDE